MTDPAIAGTAVMADVRTVENEIVELVRTFLRSQLGERTPEISGLVKASLGRSRENWLFDAVWRDGDREVREPLIIRRDPLGGLVESERSTEFALLKALENSSIPAPHVRWLDATGEWLGRPSLIMRRESGASDYYILNGDRPLEARVAIAEKLCDLLGELHLVDWKAFGVGDVLEDPGEWPSLVELDRFVHILHADQLEPYPEVELAVLWLRENAPRAEKGPRPRRLQGGQRPARGHRDRRAAGLGVGSPRRPDGGPRLGDAAVAGA